MSPDKANDKFILAIQTYDANAKIYFIGGKIAIKLDKLDEAMKIATEQAKIFKDLTGNDELVSFQIGGNPRTICRQRRVEMDKLGGDDQKVSTVPPCP